ncbi:winged helix-turn-helix domain-containing protein [Pelagibacteraceae bacterium]|nr:winged helix-turn-helix domain-containing protein [Pelagibacteraceae bacterium]
MSQKSEKIICIKLQNSVLKKIFNELVEALNAETEDIEFILFESLDLKSDLPHYFISDEESITQLIDTDISLGIKKIFLISNSLNNIKTNIEIVNYDMPIKLIYFVDYITSDLRQNLNKQNKIISLNSLSYDESSRRIFNDKISLIFTEKENEIFHFLLESESSVSKKVLLKNIWKYNEGIDTHTLETHIYSLRKKLEKKLEIKNILEHKESGYFLNKDLL